MGPPGSVSHPNLAEATARDAPRVFIDDHGDPVSADDDSRPSVTTHHSEPPQPGTFVSPMRQHKRTPSTPRQIKETLDARVEFTNDESDGRTYHRINQFVIMEEIGRGSYGAVHLATDQFGTEYAVKEFSKTRLRKRAQSHILRQGPHRRPRRILASAGMQTPLSPELGSLRSGEKEDALFLIREEIAIMKKLHHPNLVQLMEVLDDPEEDSLYLVLEMCKKGVVMKVGLDDQADPYSEEACRCWFRDLLLGIEYLHAQGVIHRDIKPDNLLVSDDDVLKIVDFGVSEMFERTTEMRTSKSAGSPAFTPPELCGKHEAVSGTAADIWSMGITLFCLRYGKIPFNRDGVLEMYEAIKSDTPNLAEDENPTLADLFQKVLEKDPEKRINMAELRDHPWMTKDGADPLISAEDNCAHQVEAPNELELNRAFTRKMNHLLCVMKAIHQFKSLIGSRRLNNGSEGDLSKQQGQLDPAESRAQLEAIQALITQRRMVLSGEDEEDGSGDKGHAHDVSDQEPLFLGIGTGARDDFFRDEAPAEIVADSPTAVDFNIYDRAYKQAVERQMKINSARKPTMYLTKFVMDTEHFKKLENLVEEALQSPPLLMAPLKESGQHIHELMASHHGGKLAQLASKMLLTNPKEEATQKDKE